MAVTRKAGGAWSERFAGITRGLRDTRSELRKVTWPTRETTTNLTLVVIGLSAALGLVLGGVDWLLTELVRWLTAALGAGAGI
jgi:preprotein translocase subunit SecE